MELEEVGAIKMPKMITAKMVPIVNIKLEINMGVISPFTQEYIGLGVNAAAHMATPLEMTLTRKLTQIALDIKVPEEIKRYLSINEFVTFLRSTNPETPKDRLFISSCFELPSD